jgi:hypothetical protein
LEERPELLEATRFGSGPLKAAAVKACPSGQLIGSSLALLSCRIRGRSSRPNRLRSAVESALSHR